MEKPQCQECKKRKKKLPKMKLYTFQELEHAYQNREKYKYTPDEQVWFYNLYNRVTGQNKTPGCGKCFANIRKHLEKQYINELENGTNQ